MAVSGGWIAGDRKYLCDICGFEYRFSQMRKGISGNQKGFDVCPDCFDERHPDEDHTFKPRKEGKLPRVT